MWNGRPCGREDPVKELVEDTLEDSAEEPVEEPVEDPVEEPVEDPVDTMWTQCGGENGRSSGCSAFLFLDVLSQFN